VPDDFTRNDAMSRLNDAVRLMQIWGLFFESRLRLTEAVAAGYEIDTGNRENRIRAKLESAVEYAKSMLPIIRSMDAFVPIFGYSHQTLEGSLIERLEAEIAWLSDFDIHLLIQEVDAFRPPDNRFTIRAAHNYPNPFKGETTFIYELTRDADAVSIAIYTTTGRRVRVLEELSAREGYNEAMWNGRDADSEPLANGVYLYKIRAIAADEQTQVIGRLAVLR
jgi:hypothetical protein